MGFRLRETGWKTAQWHSRTWWQGWTRTTDLLNVVCAFALVVWHMGLWNWQHGREWGRRQVKMGQGGGTVVETPCPGEPHIKDTVVLYVQQ